MKSKNQEQLEESATKITVALLSNSVFTNNLAKSGEQAGLSAEEMEDAMVEMAYRIARNIIKKGNEEYEKLQS